MCLTLLSRFSQREDKKDEHKSEGEVGSALLDSRIKANPRSIEMK